MLQRVLTLSCLLIVAAAAGCGGGSGPAKKATFSATGKLLVDDKPFGPANLTLSATEQAETSPSLTGKADKDGNVKFMTYGQEGVVAAGKYSVTMTGDIASLSKVPATQPGTTEIKTGDKTVDIKLQAIPGAAAVGGLAPVAAPPQ